MLNWSDFSSESGVADTPLLLSERSIQLALTAIRSIENRFRWNIPDDSDWNDIDHAVTALIYELTEVSMPDFMPVGMVVPFFGATADIPSKWLLCDGTSYAGSSYPDLFSIIPASFISGSNFFVPDLRERFVFGAPNDAGLAAVGGENTVTLTIAQIPAHNHGQRGRNGTGSTTRTLQDNGGNAGSVLNSQNTGDTGGGGSHNNVPAHVTMHYLIKALL